MDMGEWDHQKILDEDWWQVWNNMRPWIGSDLSVVLLQLLYYLLFATPGPLAGILDFYILNPLGQLLQKKVENGWLCNQGQVGTKEIQSSAVVNSYLSLDLCRDVIGAGFAIADTMYWIQDALGPPSAIRGPRIISNKCIAQCSNEYIHCLSIIPRVELPVLNNVGTAPIPDYSWMGLLHLPQKAAYCNYRPQRW